MAVSQAAEVRSRIAERTGLAVERILVGCTHTHSGPDTGLGLVLAGRPPPDWVAELLDAAAAAGVEAVESAHHAALAAGRAEVSIGCNRRSATGPIDSSAILLRVDRSDGSPLALLYLHGCHPTALGHDNLLFSADWPGAASAEIERMLPGATALFALGAHADVDPRTRGLLDLAIEGQSVGVSFEEMERLGRQVGAAVSNAAAGLRGQRWGPIGARSERLAVAVHGADLEERERERRLAESRARALEALGLPADAALRTGDFYRLERERVRGLSEQETRKRLARVRLYLRDRTAARIAGGDWPLVEVQVMRLGPLLLLGLPLECCVDVGSEWARRAGGEYSAVVSIANGWLRYLPHRRNFREELAHQKYEILQSTLVPEAADRLVEAGAELAARLDASLRWGAGRP
jgi:hypothetical protein